MSGFLAGVLAREIGSTTAGKGLLPRLPSRFETPTGPEPFGDGAIPDGLPADGSGGGETDAPPAGSRLRKGATARDAGGGDFLTGAARLPGTDGTGRQPRGVGDAGSRIPPAYVSNPLRADHDTRHPPRSRVPADGRGKSESAPLAANSPAGPIHARPDSGGDEILNRGALVPAPAGSATTLRGATGRPTSELSDGNPAAASGPDVALEREAPPPGEEIRPRLGALQPLADVASEPAGAIIHVSIGRIEIRAVPAQGSAADAKPATRGHAKPMSLDEYLERRVKGGAR